MQTRGMTHRKKQIYRSRVKSSRCRGLTSKCRKTSGCKKTRPGQRKSYCRKSSNRHI